METALDSLTAIRGAHGEFWIERFGVRIEAPL